MLTIFNTLTRNKELFHPLEPGKVRMYVCGMTVYDYCHLGHARVLVVFDMVVRYLRESGYSVTYVRNVTDIDDKIIRRAQELGESIETLTERFITAMHEDEAALGVTPPDHEPRATRSIGDMLAMIQTLIHKGHAYVGSNGDVFYAVSSFASYGQLSGKQIDDLRAGERVDVDEAKRDPLDFVLWKSAKPGEPSWESPWGNGRPGWHIECSAMSTCCLGPHFDIHGGGMDLQFPHHENEIAQSEGATGQKFVNLWMHNGFVRINEEKMSKSLGNFFTVREILARYRPEAVRFFILNSHYRSPLNYCDANLDEANSALTRLYTALGDLSPQALAGVGDDFRDRFRAAMHDDFNTPKALAVLFDLAREINRVRVINPHEAEALAGVLKELGDILGLLQDDQFFQRSHGNRDSHGADSSDSKETDLQGVEIDALITQRNAARTAKNWAEADRIRDELKSKGVILEDKVKDGVVVTTWRFE